MGKNCFICITNHIYEISDVHNFNLNRYGFFTLIECNSYCLTDTHLLSSSLYIYTYKYNFTIIIGYFV